MLEDTITQIKMMQALKKINIGEVESALDPNYPDQFFEDTRDALNSDEVPDEVKRYIQF